MIYFDIGRTLKEPIKVTRKVMYELGVLRPDGDEAFNMEGLTPALEILKYIYLFYRLLSKMAYLQDEETQIWNDPTYLVVGIQNLLQHLDQHMKFHMLRYGVWRIWMIKMVHQELSEKIKVSKSLILEIFFFNGGCGKLLTSVG